MTIDPHTVASSVPTATLLGRTMPYPPHLTPEECALADQRHMIVSEAATRLVGRATDLVAAGYSPNDAGVHLRFTADATADAIAEIFGQCSCGGCEAKAGRLLAAHLALRIGAALHLGNQP